MRKLTGWCLGFVLLVLPAQAAEPKGKLIQESWDAAYLEGNKAGYVHTTVREIEREGKKFVRTTVELDLTLKRFRDTMQTRMERSTDENPEGKVTAVAMTQSLGKQQVMELTGTVEGNQLHVKVQGQAPMDKMIFWDEKVVGLYAEQQLFKKRGAKSGDRFSYKQYEPGFNAVFNVQVEVKDFEQVEYLGTKTRLLRVDAIADKVLGVQAPPSVYWLDKDLIAVRFQTEIPGLGKLVLERTSRALALAPSTAKVDVGVRQLITLNRRIPRPTETSAVVYRIKIKGDDDAGTAFAQDIRQEVKNAKGDTFDLYVQAVRSPQKVSKPDAPAPEEFIKSNFFINSADARVKEHAARAVGKESDDWKKAQSIERWVHNNMKILNFSEAMATADHVARSLEGDCTEFAMLTAAMCRAAGVPSRVAIGLVYVDNSPRGPALAYHMWTEAWVRGQWIALDAVLGRGSIGATHLKITDHSWYETESLKPLLPVMRVTLSKPTVEVLRIDGKD